MWIYLPWFWKVFLRFLVVCPMRPGPCVFLVSAWAFPKTKLQPDKCDLGSSRVPFALVFPNLTTEPPVCVSQKRFALVYIRWEFGLLRFASWYCTFNFMAGFTIFLFPWNIILISKCNWVPSWLHVQLDWCSPSINTRKIDSRKNCKSYDNSETTIEKLWRGESRSFEYSWTVCQLHIGTSLGHCYN